MEYISKACPFCGGTQINNSPDGGCVCAYCLQPFDVSSGKLSEGYTKLESYNFVGALSFFQSMTEVADVAAEARYGEFLAKNRIEENKQKNNIYPVVYSYRPESFESDDGFKYLRQKCASDRALLQKLDKIEEARAKTLTPTAEYDVIVIADGGAAEKCNEFIKVIAERGVRVLRLSDMSNVEIAVLRCIEAAYVFASSLDFVDKISTSGLARRYALLENARMNKTGVGKKPMKIVCPLEVPDLLVGGIRDVVEIVQELNIAAEVRRLNSVLKKQGGVGVQLGKERERLAVVSTPAKERIRTQVAEIKNEAADLDRIKRSLDNGAFEDALRQAEKMQKNGCQSGKLFWYSYLAQAKTRNLSEFINNADESAFTDSALDACDKALYLCATPEEASPYVRALTGAAMRLIDRKKPVLATRALDAAFTYDSADGYADEFFVRLNAAKGSLAPADWFSLQRKVLERMNGASPEFILKNTCGAIDYALSLGEYGRADDMLEGILDYFPSESSLYARKLCCDNKIKSVDEIYKIDYPRLGNSFACYVAAQKENASNVLRDAFSKFVNKASSEGFDKYASAIDEVLTLGQMPELSGGAAFTLDDMCRAGELALKSGNFDFASAYFMDAISRDKTCYKAYWGALKAELKCRTDKQLEECETPIDGEGASNYYSNAYRTAYDKGDTAFVDSIERVRHRQSDTKKKDGHVFRKDDFVIENGNVVRYVGSGTERVFVSGGAYRIGANAFRGADCKSVIVDGGITSIGDYAFAFSDIEQIAVPQSVSEVGANPFCGCDKLKSVYSSGKLAQFGGGVYFGSRLVSFLPSLQQGNTVAEIKSGTSVIGEKAFYKPKGITEIKLGGADEFYNCAFYGCEGIMFSGSVPATKTALTGEGIFGDCEIVRGKIENNQRERWESLYGGCDNNMAADGDIIGDSKVRYQKLFDTAGKVTSGILVKNGKALYTAAGALFVAPLSDAFEGRQVTPVKVQLAFPASGTGALWNEYLIQPTERDRCSLEYVSPQGKSDFAVRIGDPLTRPMCLMGDYMLCISGYTVISVDLRRGKIIGKRALDEKITSVPCGLNGKFIVAGERCLYALTPELSGGAVHTLKGVTYSQGTGKILRNRIVSYGGVAYWVERNDSNILLCAYDGKTAFVKPMSRSVVDFMQTQPIFYDGNFYGGETKSVVTAKVESLEKEWSFKFLAPLGDKYLELAVIGGMPYINPMTGETANLRLRSIYKGRALLVDIANGGIYAGRI